jgi:uncharacterized protein (TIGR02594 family)
MKRSLLALVCALTVTFSIADANARPRHHRAHHHHASHHQVVKVQQPFSEGFQFGFSAGNGVVSRAREYIGASARQVGVRSTLWCSAFLRKITGASGVDDNALSWERKQHIAPQVGAIVTMGRGRRGGHVGVVSGFTASGDPIVISGNHSGRVAESVYSRSRIRAWVSAS